MQRIENVAKHVMFKSQVSFALKSGDKVSGRSGENGGGGGMGRGGGVLFCIFVGLDKTIRRGN